MPKYSTESIRTIALVGHTGAGKTTLAEALLAKAGAIAAVGSVERGNTVCDFDPLEKLYKHSLNSALVNFAWKNVHIHLIDTPGSPDFMGQAIGALAAVETAVIVLNAETGIQLATDRMLKWAAKRNLCRMIVVNRIELPRELLRAEVKRFKAAQKATHRDLDAAAALEPPHGQIEEEEDHDREVEQVAAVDHTAADAPVMRAERRAREERREESRHRDQHEAAEKAVQDLLGGEAHVLPGDAEVGDAARDHREAHRRAQEGRADEHGEHQHKCGAHASPDASGCSRGGRKIAQRQRRTTMSAAARKTLYAMPKGISSTGVLSRIMKCR